MTPHEQLPASYLASCEKFFKSLSAKQRAASIDKKQIDVHGFNNMIKVLKFLDKEFNKAYDRKKA